MIDFFPVLLIALILCLTFVVIDSFDFLEPSVVVVGMMTFSTAMAFISSTIWGLSISFKGFAFILLVTLMFVAGGFIAKKCFPKNGERRATSNSFHIYDISWTAVLLVCLLLLFMLYMNVSRVHALSMLHGNSEGIEGYFNMIRVVRPLLESGEISSFGLMFGVFFNMSRLIAYIFIYLFAYNLLYSKAKRADFRLLLPALLEIPFQILTTGRLGLFVVVVYTLVVASILYQKGENYSFKSKLNTFKIMLVGGVLFVGAFLLMGMLTWKGVTAERTPLIILSHYAGLSVPALDTLTQMTIAESGYIGSHTLQGVYRILHALFVQIPPLDVFLPFVRFNGIDTNVYTMFGQYLMDYGYIGALALAWIFGFLYTFCYKLIKTRESNIETPIIMYGYFAYPLFLCSISERIFMDFTNTAGAFAIVLFVMVKIIFSKRFLYSRKKNHSCL